MTRKTCVTTLVLCFHKAEISFHLIFTLTRAYHFLLTYMQWRTQRAMGAMAPPFLPTLQSAALAGTQEVLTTNRINDAN